MRLKVRISESGLLTGQFMAEEAHPRPVQDPCVRGDQEIGDRDENKRGSYAKTQIPPRRMQLRGRCEQDGSQHKAGHIKGDLRTPVHAS
jgi:hypothetical protein